MEGDDPVKLHESSVQADTPLPYISRATSEVLMSEWRELETRKSIPEVNRLRSSANNPNGSLSEFLPPDDAASNKCDRFCLRANNKAS